MTAALVRTRSLLTEQAPTALVTIALSALLAGAVAKLPSLATAALIGAVVFVWAAVALPVRLLPSLALVVFALLPVQDGPHARVLRLASPLFVAIVVWLARSLASNGLQLRRELGDASLLLAGVFLASTILSRNVRSSLLFSLVVATALVVCPLVSRSEIFDGEAFFRTFLAVGTVLALAAVAERFVLHANPLFDPFYARANPPVVTQHWETYRATTSLGHPLVNGAFFATTFTLAVARWIRGHGFVGAACAAAALGGIVASGSRSGFVAAGCGTVVAILTARSGLVRSRSWATRLAGGGVLAAGGWLAAAKVIHARASSASAASEAYHRSIFTSGWSIIRHAPFLGYGPNEARLAQEGAYGVALRLPLESMWLEVGVAMGLAGLVALGWWVVRVVIAMFRRESFDALAAFVALLVALSFFNAFEGQTPVVLLLGLVAAAGLARTPARRW